MKIFFTLHKRLMYNGESGIFYPALFVLAIDFFLPFTSFCDMIYILGMPTDINYRQCSTQGRG
jgi:hypothetical protein